MRLHFVSSRKGRKSQVQWVVIRRQEKSRIRILFVTDILTTSLEVKEKKCWSVNGDTTIDYSDQIFKSVWLLWCISQLTRVSNL